MQPALACPSIGTSPPPWTTTLLPLDWRLIVYPLLALPICFVFRALALRGVPAESRRTLKPWLIAMSALLFIAACSATFSFVVVDRWLNILLQWQDQVSNLPGFLNCQYTELDSKYYNALSSGVLMTAISFGALSLAGIPWNHALSIRRAILATYRSPDIPGVPDDLAARRAINHRPYRRRGFRSRRR